MKAFISGYKAMRQDNHLAAARLYVQTENVYEFLQLMGSIITIFFKFFKSIFGRLLRVDSNPNI